MRKARGFTLIEVVAVVAIIGILTAIAIPSYQQHLRKGRRANAEAFLSDVASREQQYLLDARGYALGATAIADLGLTLPNDVSNFYAVTVTPAAPAVPPAFTVTATPIAGGVQAPDGTLAIDNNGTKTRLISGVDQGW
ncbi:MAG TPA: type IV pilin protein [Usitatibacter sp.]|jgi:type IV pilus assembly protein PilE|nr:type IV pilin protein [Usitatibacter sp.]